MRDVMDEVGAADLVKVDIEGGEWEILADPAFRREPSDGDGARVSPPPLSGPDPRAEAESAARGGAACTSRTIWHRDDGYGMLWAWRD